MITLLAIQIVCSAPSPPKRTVDTALFVYEDKVNGVTFRQHGDTVWSITKKGSSRMVESGPTISLTRSGATGVQQSDFCVQGDRAVLVAGPGKGRSLPVSQLVELREMVEAARGTELRLLGRPPVL